MAAGGVDTVRIPKAAELVARGLRARIVGGDLAEGAPLPPEGQLMAQFGVARTTVLARIARLEAASVIVGYTVRLGSEAADGGVQAYVGISINAKMQRDVIKRLTRLPERSSSTIGVPGASTDGS